MKKKKFFAGLLVLVFVISFSVSQVMLAGDKPPKDDLVPVIEIGKPCLMGCHDCWCVWVWSDNTFTIHWGGQFL